MDTDTASHLATIFGIICWAANLVSVIIWSASAYIRDPQKKRPAKIAQWVTLGLALVCLLFFCVFKRIATGDPWLRIIFGH
jgi:apolipoprotein N-acyltransferase